MAISTRAVVDEDVVPGPLSLPLAGLGCAVAAMATVTASVGVLSGPAPVVVQTVRGTDATLFGQGVYRYETLFAGAADRGTDVVTLALGVPLLLVTLWLVARGSTRAALLLPGALGWFLYVYATLAVRAAFGPLFLVNTALFAASLWAVVLALQTVWTAPLETVPGRTLPRRSAGTLLLISGVVTALLWLVPIAAAQLAGQVPARLDTYPTAVTEALDSAVITPAVLIAGVLILRDRPRGFVIAVPLLVLETFLAPMIAAQSVSQLSSGVVLTPGEVVGPLGGFVVLSLLAGWVLVRLLSAVAEPASEGSGRE